METTNLLREYIDIVLSEKKKKDDSDHPRQYGAPEGSKRDEKLDAAAAAYKRGDIDAAVRIRTSMEKKEREKKDWKNRPRSDTKESIELTEEDIIEIVREVVTEELSKKTKSTLRKKAQKRGLTPGSVEAEYKKGLAAWLSSGSRKGMSQHQWAMARVNSATPSKDWAVVKKSKRKKK